MKTSIDFLFERMMDVTWLQNRDEISSSRADEMRSSALADAKEKFRDEVVSYGYSVRYDHKRPEIIFEEKFNK